MNEILKQLKDTFIESIVNLLPVLIIIIGFQLFVFQEVPENLMTIILGFCIVIVGVTFFLMAPKFFLGLRQFLDLFLAFRNFPQALAEKCNSCKQSDCRR